MVLVCLTGGIGSGKSTVARMLESRGAVVLDADVFAGEAVRRGSTAFDEVVRRFGSDVVRADGALDRARLASIAFSDREALRDLEAIVHPHVRRMIADGVAEHAGTNHVVVVVNPLLLEMGLHRDCDVVVVVSAAPDTQVRRSTARGMVEADVRARMAAQMSPEERARQADVVLDNDGTRGDLERQVDRLWERLRAPGGRPG
jgi:dephospho-CoA kinase